MNNRAPTQSPSLMPTTLPSVTPTETPNYQTTRNPTNRPSITVVETPTKLPNTQKLNNIPTIYIIIFSAFGIIFFCVGGCFLYAIIRTCKKQNKLIKDTQMMSVNNANPPSNHNNNETIHKRIEPVISKPGVIYTQTLPPIIPAIDQDMMDTKGNYSSDEQITTQE